MRLVLLQAVVLLAAACDAFAFTKSIPTYRNRLPDEANRIAAPIPARSSSRSSSVFLAAAVGRGTRGGNPQTPPQDPKDAAKYWVDSQMKDNDSRLNTEIQKQLTGGTLGLSVEGLTCAVLASSVELKGAPIQIEVFGLRNDVEYLKQICDEYNQKVPTIIEALDSLAKNGKVKTLNIYGNSERAYYIEGGNEAQFRHEGQLGETGTSSGPASVYLSRVDGGLPFTYYSSSGSGKTVELAGSSYVRNKDITFYLCPYDKIKTQKQGPNENREEFVQRRQAFAIEFLTKQVKSLMKRNSRVFHAIANTDKKELSVVVAIDEASHCPGLVRSIIASQIDLGQVVKDLLKNEGIKCSDVVFSIGGTGASRGTIGSLPENWKNMDTAASNNPQEVYAGLVAGKTDSSFFPSWDDLKKTSPVLHTMAGGNARMASIVVSLIYSVLIGPSGTKIDQRKFLPAIESYIVQRTMDVFMECNGLHRVLRDPSRGCRIGAQVLATHLFVKPKEISGNEAEREKTAEDLDYGIEFVDDDAVSMKDLVSKYGMVIPNPFPSFEYEDDVSKTLDKPFVVDDAMLLLALYLLRPGGGENVIEPGFAGFEVASTQIVKGALAAASMVKLSSAPTVFEVLQKLGFSYMNPIKGKKTEDFTDYYLMESFKNLHVSRHTSVGGGFSVDDLTETYRQGYPMKVQNGASTQVCFVDENLEYKDGDGDGDGENVEVLNADKMMMRILLSLREKSTLNGDLFFPFASIGYGNSDLADGYVSFFGINGDGQDKGIFTMMLQMKDYTDSLPFEDILENSNRCRSKLLSIGFGRKRLMCVAAWGEKFGGTPRKHERDFIGFSVDKSELLGDLMKRLHELKSPGRKESASFAKSKEFEKRETRKEKGEGKEC